MHRVLFVTPVAPDAAATDGGSRVIAQLIETLAVTHSVGIAYFRGEGDPALGSLEKVCDVAMELPRVARWTGKARAVAGLVMQRPLWASRWWDPRNAQRLRAAAHLWHPDVIQFEYHVTGQYAACVGDSGAARILIEHEPGVVAFNGHRTRGGPMHRLAVAAESMGWEAYERRIYRDVDRVVVFTEADRTAIRRLAGVTPIACIPFAARIPENPLSAAGIERQVLFVGNFRHHPNVDAAMWLVRELFPLIRREIPDADLTLVGPAPPDALRAAAGEGVQITGAVPDLGPYLDNAAVVVAPLRDGGGMRVKVLEALAAGKAVVGTRRAVEGLDVRDGDQVRIADAAADFAGAVVDLLSRRDDRVALAGRAYAWMRGRGGWSTVASQYEALYDRIAGTHAASFRLRGEDEK